MNDDELTPPLPSGVMRVAGGHAEQRIGDVDDVEDLVDVFDVEGFVAMTGSEPPPAPTTHAATHSATHSATEPPPKRAAG